ncbi:hypothetical protein E6H36_06565 [Candidatus Bathyarchaeota archaeon]|nr:MAG: hypothetical protein E6H36_06565 [Candidatus Bathyarchaeota archaeon]TMI29700.1 MAG: hypothetical protein E6H29_10460 [Candidatus Bathyarchaeota archaeon]
MKLDALTVRLAKTGTLLYGTVFTNQTVVSIHQTVATTFFTSVEVQTGPIRFLPDLLFLFRKSSSLFPAP